MESIKPKKEYVYVVYDPLLEKVVCVHDKPNKECKKCKKIQSERSSKNDRASLYFLEEFKKEIVKKYE